MGQRSFLGTKDAPAKSVPDKVNWLCELWNSVDGLPKIRKESTRERIRGNKWVVSAVKNLSRLELQKVVRRYAMIRVDKKDRFFDGYKRWSLFELFSRKKGEYVDHLLEDEWEKVFEKFGKTERGIPIGRSNFGGYEPKKGLAE